MGVFKWLYRLPGRINRSFGPSAVATSVEAPGMLGPDVSAMGVKVVMGEVAEATAEEAEGSHAADTGEQDVPADPAADPSI